MRFFQKKNVTLRHHISIIMVYNSIIGRNEEIRKLEKFLKSPKLEFVARYLYSAKTIQRIS